MSTAAVSSTTTVGGEDPHELPSSIGSYQVLGPLAVGGMAEILLARRAGPSGFERLVVIKRVQPRFATDPSFVAMFLDEARIVSEIRHHNVIHVEDLGRDRNELFLVMEYLSGESISGLQKRCLMSGKPLSFGLASFVIAEACAGLHAAHELVGANGKPRNLVHRDISPQNIFITYDGQVKVLDFGIAKSTERLSPQTQVGTIKGKLEYMSPEQARGQSLDRRSDVFSLGIVLYELATGHRLFKRFNPLQAIAAITTDPVLPPSRVLPGFPRVLEKVCLKALARRVEERYSSAAEMRRDLMRAMKDDALNLPDDPATELAALMRRLFEDRMAEKDELVRRARAGASVEIPAVEVDITIELPSIVRDARDASSSSSSSSVSDHDAKPLANSPVVISPLPVGDTDSITERGRVDTELVSATTGPSGRTTQPTTSSKNRESGRAGPARFVGLALFVLVLGAIGVGVTFRSRLLPSSLVTKTPTTAAPTEPTTVTAGESSNDRPSPKAAPIAIKEETAAPSTSVTAPSPSSSPSGALTTIRKKPVVIAPPKLLSAGPTSALPEQAPAPPPPSSSSATTPFRRFQ